MITEVFTIKEKRWAEFWLSQAYPVMLIIHTSDGKIRWMNVTDYLLEHGKDTKQIVFQGGALHVAQRGKAQRKADAKLRAKEMGQSAIAPFAPFARKSIPL